MKINFINGSSIESIGDASDAKRSQRGEEQIARMSEQEGMGEIIILLGEGD